MLGRTPHYNKTMLGRTPHYNKTMLGRTPHYNKTMLGRTPHYNSFTKGTHIQCRDSCRQWLTMCEDDTNGRVGAERAGGEGEVILWGNQSAVAKVQVQ